MIKESRKIEDTEKRRMAEGKVKKGKILVENKDRWEGKKWKDIGRGERKMLEEEKGRYRKRRKKYVRRGERNMLEEEKRRYRKRRRKRRRKDVGGGERNM